MKKSVPVFLTNALIALLSFSSTASAQPFLEFTFTSSGDQNTNRYYSVARFVVDASDPAQTIIPTTQTGILSLPPVGNLDQLVVAEPLPVTIHDFRVLQNGNLVIDYSINPTPGFFDAKITLNAGGPIPDPDGSFPDDPAAYTGWTDAESDADIPGMSFAGFWTSASGNFLGNCIFSLTVREVPDPNPDTAPECLADINNDGVIDFFDISAYLQLYSNGCP